MFLVVAWFAIVLFAITSTAYYIVSARAHRVTNGDPETPEAAAHQFVEYAGAAAIVVLLVAMSFFVVQSYREREVYVTASDRDASRTQSEQYRESELPNGLLFSAFNNATVAGALGHKGSSVIVEVKLQAKVQGKTCDRRLLATAAAHAVVALRTTDFTLTNRPVSDDTSHCAVRWYWIATPLHSGANIALADLTLTLGKEHLNASKPIELRVVDADQGLAISSLSSIIVGALSLAGVVFTGIMNRLAAKPRTG